MAQWSAEVPTYVNFRTGVSTCGELPKAIVLHATLMTAMLFFLSVAVPLAALMQMDFASERKTLALRLHIATSVLTVACVAGGLAIIMRWKVASTHFATTHAQMGFAVILAMVIHGAAAFVRPRKDSSAIVRLVWVVQHRYFGRAFIPLLAAVMALGVKEASSFNSRSSKTLKAITGACAFSLTLGLVLWLSIHAHNMMRKRATRYQVF